jgi:hypothetical protein
MRNSILAVVAILGIAGCSGSSNNNGGDGGIKLDQGTGADLSQGGNPDLTPVSLIGCSDLLTCENPCTTQACVTKCEKMATANAKTLLNNLTSCILGVCDATPDGGTAPCPDATGAMTCESCFAETQSGTSPTGMANGNCMDSNMAASTAAVCGLCIDPLSACAADLTM